MILGVHKVGCQIHRAKTRAHRVPQSGKHHAKTEPARWRERQHELISVLYTALPLCCRSIGMSGSKLDQIVKGAPPPSVASRTSSPAPPLQHTAAELARSTTPPLPSDPLANLPSSPPQIYLNLLILEASLRSQYLTLRARRRQHTFFLLLLFLWIAGFFYALFLRPREDGSGVGGSVYWVLEVTYKVALMGGIVTALLIWGTGQWERGVRWPRRWIGVTNRGLRTVNVKVVVLKGPWWKEMLGHLSFLFPYSSFFPPQGSNYRYIDHVSEKHSARTAFGEDIEAGTEEDLSPGGDYIKLLLLPKPFSPDFRENWEMYRTEYWERENERRANVRQLLHKRDRQLAREQGGWFWWLGWRTRAKSQETPEKLGLAERSHSAHLVTKIPKRRPSFARTNSHSRTTSRSSTPSSTLDAEERQGLNRARRGSSTASNSERRKKTKSGSNENMRVTKLTSIA